MAKHHYFYMLMVLTVTAWIQGLVRTDYHCLIVVLLMRSHIFVVDKSLVAIGMRMVNC
ncbi:hypothetical protein D3C87_2088850 [compost metagenome]